MFAVDFDDLTGVWQEVQVKYDSSTGLRLVHAYV
jgi:hypothetical protein